MALTPEQVKDLKDQLSEQIKHLPEEKRRAAQEQINSLSVSALEEMLREQQAQDPKTTNKEIFRKIVDKEIPSKLIAENKEAIVVLEIRPISKGHSIVIQKKPALNSKELSPQTFSIARKLAKRISSKLKSNGIEIQTEFKFGEVIINLIPIYDKSLSLNSPRSNPDEIQLNELEKLLKVKPRIKKPKPQKKVEPVKTLLYKIKRYTP
jgi:hypothetical protein